MKPSVHSLARRCAAMIHILQTLLVFVFPALVITAALRDVVSYTIPNWISVALIAAFPVAALAQGLPLATARR